jgi:serine/threonine-protein kinase
MGAAAATLLAECNLFRSGCQESWFTASAPVHTLVLDPYYIDETEVTNQAYAAFLNSLGSHEATCLEQSCFNPEHSRIIIGENGVYQAAEDVANFPVTGASWYGAAAYCAWRGGRLPTEAEWEKAASWNPESKTKTFYPWGDLFDGGLVSFCDVNCQLPQSNATFDDGFAEEAPVASFEDGRSPVGAYDMAGNVWEWVADWYDAQYYSNSETGNPAGPDEGQVKVVRGGSWFDTGNLTAAAIRFPSPPTNTDRSIGFRCAADP